MSQLYLAQCHDLKKGASMSLFFNPSLLNCRLERFSQLALLLSTPHTVHGHEIAVGTGVIPSLESLRFNFPFVSWHKLWHSVAFFLDLS